MLMDPCVAKRKETEREDAEERRRGKKKPAKERMMKIKKAREFFFIELTHVIPLVYVSICRCLLNILCISFSPCLQEYKE